MQTFDTIHNRLKSKAAQRFHRSAEQLEREHQLFLEWTAWELSVLYRELGQSRDYIEKNVIRKLTTELELRPKPVHALVQAQPKKNATLLQPEEEPFTVQRMSTEPPHEIYFTPLRPTKLVNAKVRFCAKGNSLSEWEDGQLPKELLSTLPQQNFHDGVLWWGIELGKDFDTEELCIHIDFKSKKLYELLPLIQWQIQEQAVESEVGFGNWLDQKRETTNRRLDGEYLFLQQLEKNVLQQYETAFVTLKNVNKIPREVSVFPAELLEKFEEESLQEYYSERMLWIKMIFPSGFTAAEVAQTRIRLNCFPILNRKIDKSKDRSPSSSDFFEIIPLSNAESHRASLADTGDFFLGLQKLTSENGTAYRATTYEDFHNAPVGYYALQAGKVEAHDFRDLQSRVAELTHYLKTETAKLKKIVHHNLGNALSSIETATNNLSEELERIPPKDHPLGYYLHIKLLDNQQMIYVRFWVTQGGFAEGVLRRGEVLRGSGGVELVVI